MKGASRPLVIVLGMIGRTPFAGVAWQALHYLEGLRRLGCDVYYVEDTGEWPYDPEQNTVTDDSRFTTGYIARMLEWCGLSGRWAYCSAAEAGRVYGLTPPQLAELWLRADVLINLTGATLLRDEHMRVPVRIFLETDPVRPQIEVAQGDVFTTELLAAHTHLFTFGENLGAPDCGVPLGRFDYRPTRQPVVTDWWDAAHLQVQQSNSYTTIASWQQAGKDIEWNGELYHWSKHLEFLKFIDLPERARCRPELALACGDAQAIRLLESHGWHVADALRISRDFLGYRAYIAGSRAEFTVAKDQNIRLRSGWFSDRSATYLAAGKPVITQDTAFGNVLPTGRGLFAFRTMDEILAAMEAIEADYEAHSRAAQEIAREYFDAEKVLANLLEQVGH